MKNRVVSRTFLAPEAYFSLFSDQTQKFQTSGLAMMEASEH